MQQFQWIDVDQTGDALQASQRQVALPAFQAAHVGAVDTDDIGESLGETECLPVSAQVPANGTLQVTFHRKPQRFRAATCRSTDL